MENRTVSVKISAPTLSVLLHENINAGNDQEGFLIGTINTTIVKSVTDNTREEVKIKDVINITAILPCDLPHMYYQGNGELIKEKLTELLGKDKKNVVAWFKYKKYRKYGLKFSLRERILHEELANYLNIAPYLFTCCLLTSSQNNNAIQIFSHAFINMSDYKQKLIPMNIENLGDSCHIYQTNTKPSASFMKLYKKINKDQSDLELGKDIYNSLKTELVKSISTLEASEIKILKLRKEVEELNKKLRKSVFASRLYAGGDNNMEISPEQDDLEIDIPLSPDNKDPLNSSVDSKPDDIEMNSSHVVDLTISDEDEEISNTLKSLDKRK